MWADRDALTAGILARRALFRKNPPSAVLGVLLLAVAVAGMGCAATTASSSVPRQTAQRAVLQAGIRYWLSVRADPRPLRFHHLEIDLSAPRLEVAAVLTADPDEAGPATAVLQPPLDIARLAAAVALVNANPWQGLAAPSGKRPTHWHAGMPVDILGLAVSGGQVRSRPLDAHCGFWIDPDGCAHVGTPADLGKVREGVAGFGRLLEGGQIVPPPGGPVHPRTALGLDESRRRLVLVVVDGRQPGYSEGMTTGELAAYMKELGCRDAVNLDGGGSSIMMIADESGNLRVMNDTSTKHDGTSVPRPIPVALVVRARR